MDRGADRDSATDRGRRLVDDELFAELVKSIEEGALISHAGVGPICNECGRQHGTCRVIMSTYHHGQCAWCGETKQVTDSRDFNYPALPESSE